MSLPVNTQLLRLAQRVDPLTKSGQYLMDLNSAIAIASSTNATPIQITTAVAHGLKTGNQVFISGHALNVAANNTPSNPNWTILVNGATTFTLNNSVGTGVGSATGNVYPAMIGAVPGAAFPSQLLMDRYNDARLLLATVLKQRLPLQQFMLETSGNIVNNTGFSFTSGVAQKPSGFIESVALYDASYNKIEVIPASQLEAARTLETSSLRFVIDSGSTLSTITGNTNVPDATNYILWYYWIPIYLLTDATGGVTLESFNDKYFPVIIEVAELLCNEVGTQQVAAFITAFLGGK